MIRFISRVPLLAAALRPPVQQAANRIDVPQREIIFARDATVRRSARAPSTGACTRPHHDTTELSSGEMQTITARCAVFLRNE
jgi:hypothetical protein